MTEYYASIIYQIFQEYLVMWKTQSKIKWKKQDTKFYMQHEPSIIYGGINEKKKKKYSNIQWLSRSGRILCFIH